MTQKLLYELNHSDKDLWLKDDFNKRAKAIEREMDGYK